MAAELTLDEAGALAPLISGAEAAERVAAGAVLVDVRRAAAREHDGEVPGATAVDKADVDDAFDLGDPEHLAAVTDKDTPLVLFCGSVRGSGPTARRLRDAGFTNVVHVDGGFDALRDAGAGSAP